MKHSAPPPTVLIVSYPSNPTAQWVDLDFYKDVVALARRHDLLVLSDMAYSEIYFENNPPPSHPAGRGRARPGGRGQQPVEDLRHGGLARRHGGRQRPHVRGAGAGEELPRLRRLHADPGRRRLRAQRPAGVRRRDPRHLQVAPRRAGGEHGRAGWAIPSPPASMFAWAQVPEPWREAGSMAFSKALIEEAGVAGRPGVGFGEYGEGYVRIGLVENEHRIRQAARNVKRFPAGRGRRPRPSPAVRGAVAAMAEEVLRVGVAGLGTVGGALVQFLAEQPTFAPGGRRVEVSAGAARSRSRPRATDISALPWFDDPVALAQGPWRRPLRGADRRLRRPAKAAVEAALSAGKRGDGEQGAARGTRVELAKLAEERACRCCSRPR
jgi:hypothetical protein